jgi:hypothetical protein
MVLVIAVIFATDSVAGSGGSNCGGFDRLPYHDPQITSSAY